MKQSDVRGNPTEFEKRVASFQRRVEGMRRAAKGKAGRAEACCPQVLEELSTAMEELSVAHEELTQQNEELSAAQSALEAQRARYQELFDFAPDGYMVMDDAGKILEANRAMTVLLGVPQRMLPGKFLALFVPLDHRKGFRQFLLEIVRASEPRHAEFPIHPRTGDSFAGEIAVAAVTDSRTGKVTLRAMLRDISGLKRVEKRVIQAADAERLRIGHDLHDSLGQNLTGMAFIAKGLADAISKECPIFAAQADQISSLAQECVAQARTFAHGLAPATLGVGGLTAGLQELAERISQAFKVTCQFKPNGGSGFGGPQTAPHLYRIAQEAVANAVQHGKATRIDIVLKGGKKHTLAVLDNGQGIARKPDGKGTGMHLMEYRAHAVGGTLTVKPRRPRGTVVICTFPTA